jgi:hypothetical protein
MDFDVLLPLGSLVMKERVEGQDRHPGLMTEGEKSGWSMAAG